MSTGSQRPGDPNPRSPADVLADPSYRRVHTEQMPNGFTSAVVFHGGTETYWQVFYDPNATRQPGTWHEVEPVTKTVTTYRYKPSI